MIIPKNRLSSSTASFYGPLRNLELFNQVTIDPEVETLVWPNGADFDPATLHDWPANEQAFRDLARRWEAVDA
ncbi:MAG TPA: hypothetical protein VGZ73_30115 [Bryobacteraceae bacterium]|jgi:hypothetical protein|nr:hypothetical protein [Bryobacteraceae bacterium]